MEKQKNDDCRIEDDKQLEWKLVKSDSLVHDEWIDFRVQEFEFPDGRRFSPFYNYTRRDYVVIVALDENNQYIAVRQFRQGIQKVTVEFCAGCIELNETPLEAAQRELREETGCASQEWIYLHTVPTEATIADNQAHLFLARNCRRISGQDLDETEFLHHRIYSEAYILRSIADGSFAQAMHILAYYLAKEKVEIM